MQHVKPLPNCASLIQTHYNWQACISHSYFAIGSSEAIPPPSAATNCSSYTIACALNLLLLIRRHANLPFTLPDTSIKYYSFKIIAFIIHLMQIVAVVLSFAIPNLDAVIFGVASSYNSTFPTQSAISCRAVPISLSIQQPPELSRWKFQCCFSLLRSAVNALRLPHLLLIEKN